MDWPLAIEKNRERLLAVIVALIASLGLTQNRRLTTLPHYLYRRTLAILRPAEAALRRLIVMAAYDLQLRGFVCAKSRPALSFAPLLAGRRCPNGADEGQRGTAFRLIKPLKSFDSDLPDFTNFGTSQDDRFSENGEPANRAPVAATALGLRMLALQHALNNLPRQAKRLARWYAARDIALQNNLPHRLSPMRPGLPPAYLKRPKQDIGNILLDCHSLANDARDRQGMP
jgi:hypothetical protein